MYASARLVTKNSVASAAVIFEKKVDEPRAPNTVPDAPLPKPAPASAPFPRCSSTSPMIDKDSNRCTTSNSDCSMVFQVRAGGQTAAVQILTNSSALSE